MLLPGWLITAAQSATFITFVISLIITSIGKLIQVTATPKAKIVWAVITSRVFKTSAVGTPDIFTNVGEMWIKNSGRSYAEGLEVIFNTKPQHYEVFPVRAYTDSSNVDGAYILKFNDLNADEQFSIIMLNINQSLPHSINVRWKGGLAKNIFMLPQEVLSRNKKMMYQFLIVAGVFCVVYALVGVGLSLVRNEHF
jgi:hypothetical protein